MYELLYSRQGDDGKGQERHSLQTSLLTRLLSVWGGVFKSTINPMPHLNCYPQMRL